MEQMYLRLREIQSDAYPSYSCRAVMWPAKKLVRGQNRSPEGALLERKAR